MKTAMYLQVVALLSWLTLVVSLEALDPEESEFIQTRCKEDNPGNKNCILKCVLEKAGTYNPATKKFDGELVKKQQEKYPDLAPKDQADALADAVSKLPSAENSCDAVAQAYEPVRSKYNDLARNLFHINKDKAKQMYDKLGKDIKQPGQSYFHFCEEKFYPPGSPNRQDICKIRLFQVLDDDTYKKRVQCVYKGLRYITKDDKFDPSEMKRDFKLVGKDIGKLDKALEKCKSTEPQDALSLARHYYKCLVESEVSADYKDAIDYREVRSMDYYYNIPTVKPYNKAAVREQVVKIDDMQCPKA